LIVVGIVVKYWESFRDSLKTLWIVVVIVVKSWDSSRDS